MSNFSAIGLLISTQPYINRSPVRFTNASKLLGNSMVFHCASITFNPPTTAFSIVFIDGILIVSKTAFSIS